MKPSKIRITESNSNFANCNEVYDVEDWHKGEPRIMTKDYGIVRVTHSKWEPVFQAGDPVWAWDYEESDKLSGHYIGKSEFSTPFPFFVDVYEKNHWVQFKNISWREEKKQITLNELAEKAGINLNEYEIVE